jgi:hypothetical protein
MMAQILVNRPGCYATGEGKVNHFIYTIQVEGKM